MRLEKPNKNSVFYKLLSSVQGGGADMDTITISTKNHETYSSVSNFFIDYYMTEASGEFVKVYLYLVRLLNSGRAVTIADIADHFESTEKDICRAIRYWIKQKVLKLEYTNDGDNKTLTGITLLPLTPKAAKSETDLLLSMLGVTDSDEHDESIEIDKPSSTDKSSDDSISLSSSGKAPSAGEKHPAAHEAAAAMETEPEESISSTTVPKKVRYKAAFIASKQEDEDFGNLLYQTEIYFGKPLTQTDINCLLYIYEELKFTPELLEYLVEYCVSIGKKSCRYIEVVAIEWYKNGIKTVDEAKVASKNYNSIYVAVLKQLGIPNRVPTPTETEFIDTWYNTYSFNKNIIIEACRRAILVNPRTANFKYVNGILESWHKQNVHTLSDIQKLDEKWEADKKKKTKGGSSSSNQFNQYKNSTDNATVSELEKQFLEETNN